VRAQEPGAEPAQTTKAPAPAPCLAASATPLPRFVPRDNLLFYFGFDGLDAHAEAWRKAVAHEMLNSTPLGVMLEEVATQLLGRVMNQMPGCQLSVANARESQPDLLASLPGTLQAQINNVISNSAGKAGSPRAVPGASVLPMVAVGPAAGAVGGPGMRRNELSAGERGGGGGTPSGYPGAAGRSDAPEGAGCGSAGSQVNWIRLKVAPTHLPKAEDLETLMFPGTLAVVADDLSIRLVSCESFPKLSASAAACAAALSLTLPAIQAARARAQGGPDVRPGGLAPGQLGPGLAAAGPGSFPGAVSGTEGATAPATAGAVAPGPLSPSRLGRPAPGNRGPG